MEPLTADDPRQVSVFLLQSRLGAGGMGRVYLATSPGGRAVAVKVVHPELARDPEFMQRFRREVEAAEAVSGAYTAPVVGAGPDDSPPWLATAYVAGPSLAELVERAGPLPEAAVWRLAGGLVEALQAIHRRGLVHRDLKPGNILIAADGPRVIDFGISRALHGKALTTASTTMGTPAYMSPEQAGGSEIGPPSDVFALGSVLAFAATGTAPFEGGEALAVIYRIVNTDPDLRALPPALGSLIAACLAKDPASRPSLDALIGAVNAASATFPENVPGQFWPDAVAAVIAGQTGGGGRAVQAPGGRAAPARRTEAVGAETVGAEAVGTGAVGAAIRPAAGSAAPTARSAGPASDTVPGRRAGRRWLLGIAAAGVAAAAVGATLALVAAPGSPDPAGTTGQTSASPPAGSGRATAPAAVTSPTASPIAVTVCVYPADGCTQPGAAQYMEVQPKQLTDSGDDSAYVKDLVWSNWGGPRATATGIQELNSCTPNCATGTYTGYPATVTLAGLKSYGSGLEAYSTIVVRSPAAGTTETYTTQTVP